MSGNELYLSMDRIAAEREILSKKLSIAEKKLSSLFATQAIAESKLIEAQALARGSLNAAQEVEQAALIAEQAVASLHNLRRKGVEALDVASLKAKQVQFTAKLIAA